MVFFISTSGPCQKENIESHGKGHKRNGNVAKGHDIDFRTGAAQSRTVQKRAAAKIGIGMISGDQSHRQRERHGVEKSRFIFFPKSHPENNYQRKEEDSLPPAQDARLKTH